MKLVQNLVENVVYISNSIMIIRKEDFVVYMILN
jgi:hypothetical protein